MDSELPSIEDNDEWAETRQMLNVGAAFSALMVAADVIERASFDSEDVAGILKLPLELRMETTARILDAAEGIREELRSIDGLLLELTAGRHAPA